jgi:uncharacterized protein DUF4833
LARLLLLLATLGAPGDSRHEGCPAELFRIARSKNANVVVYEANLVRNHELDDREPVRAVWLMEAEDGRREDLTFLEWRLAYGFDVRAVSAGDELRLTLKAQPTRPIRIGWRNGCPSALAVISGRQAILRRISVEASEGGLVPSVRSVTLSGEDARTGGMLQETIRARDPHLAARTEPAAR